MPVLVGSRFLALALFVGVQIDVTKSAVVTLAWLKHDLDSHLFTVAKYDDLCNVLRLVF